ncbi:MAG: DUF4185 domain-containing protein [Myxococcales bacterium]|nr:DUF4185 domain-containing protein [Myxococcales bacterium]
MLCACGSRAPIGDDSGPPLGDAAAACAGNTPPRCIKRRGCSAPELVAPQCDAASGQFSCPAGAQVYQRAQSSGSCRPFYGAPGVSTFGAGVTVEAADGRCLWLFGGSDGSGPHHPVAAVAGDYAPGSCPTGPLVTRPDGTALDSVDLTNAGSDKLVSLLHSVRVGQRTYVYYRLYVWDANAVFGVRGLGVGVAPFDETTLRIPISSQLLWPNAQDFGDAVVRDASDQRVYLTGCGRSKGLTGDCHLARIDGAANLADTGAYQYWVGGDQWTRDTSSARVALFDSGPERSVVQRHGGGYVHIFIAGFGSTIEVRTAPAIEGPWTKARNLVRCDLPEDDPDAYCAEPMLHPELSDPTRPDELVITHNVRSLAKDQDVRRRQRPADYTLRLVRGQL